MRNLFKSIMKWPLWFFLFVLAGTGAFFALTFTGQAAFNWIPVAVIAVGTLAYVIIWYAALKKRMSNALAIMSVETAEGLEDKMAGLADPYALVDEDGKLVWRNNAFDQMLENYGTDEMLLSEWLGDIFPDAERFWTRWLGQEDDAAGLAADSIFAQDLYHQMVFASHGVALPDDFRRSPFVLRRQEQ